MTRVPLPMRLGAIAVLLVAPAASGAQAPTMHAIREAEDARARTAKQLATLRAGAQARSVAVRATAVRALGRLERADLIPSIASALADTTVTVRRAAAFALVGAASHAGASEARTAITARLGVERDPWAAAAMAEAIGWIPAPDSATARATASQLVGVVRAFGGDSAPTAVLWGAAHGFLGLARQRAARTALPADATDLLAHLASHRGPRDGRDDVEVRVLAVMALTAGPFATEQPLARALDDREWTVRLATMRGVASGALGDSAAAERLAHRAMTDPSPMVRAAAVAAHVRRFPHRLECTTYEGAARDKALVVQLAGIDALPGGCPPARAASLADSIAATLPRPRGAEAGEWHAPAHALLALAVVAPETAAMRLPPFVNSPDLFVREYAARAADRLGDTATLKRLARDPHPNVRSSAVTGLSTAMGHAADSIYLAQLGTDDNQLLMVAAKALEGSPDAEAKGALRRAFDRVTAEGRETMGDSRSAIVHTLATLGDSSRTLTPMTARRSSVPDERELAKLASARIALRMADGGRIGIRLFPYDAPTNAARFARLVRSGKLDGLTIHRVVPTWIVQGGSPDANEYAGWGAYSRDELGVPNRRGSLGLSTRGRDTGDGQFYIDISNPFDLDHNYTIFGEVVSGMDVVDRMQEGARIRRATISR